jgi:hypothetical protein
MSCSHHSGLAARRELAASLATEIVTHDPGTPADWSDMAKEIFAFLGGPMVVTLIIGPVLDQVTGQPTGTIPKGSPMQLHDNEKVDFIVAETDVKGANVPDDPTSTLDDLTWSIDDSSVATLSVSPDTRTCTATAGQPGSGVITVATADGTLSATVALDVIPSGATALTVTAGTPSLA